MADLSWRRIAEASRAIALAFNPSKFPDDIRAIINALASSPEQAERMRLEHESEAALESLRTSRSRGEGPHDLDMAGW